MVSQEGPLVLIEIFKRPSAVPKPLEIKTRFNVCNPNVYEINSK